MAEPNLTLHQGNPQPLYANTNIWNTVGTPVGNQQQDPSVSQDNWMHANVQNTGDASAVVTVRFYFCAGGAMTWGDFQQNPAGSAGPTTVPAGQTVAMTSNTAWRPPVQGHTCLLAVAGAPNDPPPDQDPSQAPQINDRHIAQRNMTALQLAAGHSLEIPMLMMNTPGTTLRITQANVGEAGAALHAEAEVADSSGITASWAGEGTGGARLAAEAGPVTEIQGDGTESVIRTVRVQAPAHARPGQLSVFRVEAIQGGEVVNGNLLIVEVAAG